MKVRPGHLAHQGDLADRRYVRPFLGCADGRQGQFPQTVGAGHQPADIFGGNTRHRPRRRHEHHVRAGADERPHIFLRDDILPAFRQHAGRMHLPGDEHHPVAEFLPEFPERMDDGRVRHAHPRIAGEDDKVHAHVNGFAGILHGRRPPGSQMPFPVRLHGALHIILQGFQIDPHSPAGQPLHFPDHIFRRRLRQPLHLRLIHIKQVQDQQVRAHGAGELRIGHIPEHGPHRPDGLAHQEPALAPRNGVDQLRAVHLQDIRRRTV